MVQHPKFEPILNIPEHDNISIRVMGFLPCSRTGQWYPGTYYADGGYAMASIWLCLRMDLCLEILTLNLSDTQKIGFIYSGWCGIGRNEIG